MPMTAIITRWPWRRRWKLSTLPSAVTNNNNNLGKGGARRTLCASDTSLVVIADHNEWKQSETLPAARWGDAALRHKVSGIAPQSAKLKTGPAPACSKMC